jgi:GDP/UDP-N,N'-diacetylbacillosamine 2-epimerase (hydrolysing)
MIVSSNRADLGLLLPLIKNLRKKINCEFILTGSHFIKSFGNTSQIVKNKKVKFSKIIIGKKFDNEINALNVMSLTIKKFSLYLKKNKIKKIILLGDRYEIFSIAISAFVLRIPIIHLHGGETTLNALDDAFRHSISLMASHHFVIHESYKNKLISLGIDKKNIYNVGSIGAHNISKLKNLTNFKLRKQLNIYNNLPNILISYHTETLAKDYGVSNFKKILKTLKYYKSYNLIIFKPNFDPKNKIIDNIINKFCKDRENVYVIKSLEQSAYLSLMKSSKLLIGNSSSGIIESPSFKIPVINVGKRQEGRIISKNIISLKQTHLLKKKIDLALSNIFRTKIKKLRNPFYKKNTLELITKKILKINGYNR